MLWFLLVAHEIRIGISISLSISASHSLTPSLDGCTRSPIPHPHPLSQPHEIQLQRTPSMMMIKTPSSNHIPAVEMYRPTSPSSSLTNQPTNQPTYQAPRVSPAIPYHKKSHPHPPPPLFLVIINSTQPSPKKPSQPVAATKQISSSWPELTTCFNVALCYVCAPVVNEYHCLAIAVCM